MASFHNHMISAANHFFFANGGNIPTLYLFKCLGKYVYAFSLDPLGANLPIADGDTAWTFQEKISGLKFVPGSDLEAFGEVLCILEARGFYLFEGCELKLGSAFDMDEDSVFAPQNSLPI